MAKVFLLQWLRVSYWYRQRAVAPAWHGPYLGSRERVDLFDRAIPHGLDGLNAGKKCITHAH